jgi:hypothetical protein
VRGLGALARRDAAASDRRREGVGAATCRGPCEVRARSRRKGIETGGGSEPPPVSYGTSVSGGIAAPQTAGTP